MGGSRSTPSLRDGLDCALAQLDRFEGEVHIQDGTRMHRLLLRQGRVVAASVAGHFDPVLKRLRHRGALSRDAYASALEELARSERRSGEIATRFGVPAISVQQTLRAQLEHALSVLRRRVGRTGSITLVPRTVTAMEVTVWRQPAVRRAKRSRRARESDQQHQHRALRRSAMALHPDRLMHLPATERRKREERLARINAVLQGL